MKFFNYIGSTLPLTIHKLNRGLLWVIVIGICLTPSDPPFTRWGQNSCTRKPNKKFNFLTYLLDKCNADFIKLPGFWEAGVRYPFPLC